MEKGLCHTGNGNERDMSQKLQHKNKNNDEEKKFDTMTWNILSFKVDVNKDGLEKILESEKKNSGKEVFGWLPN